MNHGEWEFIQPIFAPDDVARLRSQLNTVMTSSGNTDAIRSIEQA